jgi:DNA-binding response OmpR family regulator
MSIVRRVSGLRMELLARVEAQLRRATVGVTLSTEVYQFGDVRVDFRRAEAYSS